MLEQFDKISGRIFEKDLPSSYATHVLIPEPVLHHP
jgi:hypothetical protein